MKEKDSIYLKEICLNHPNLEDLTYRTLNQIQDIIIWSKPDGKLLYFNDAVTTQLGYKREEFWQINRSEFIQNYDKSGQNHFRNTMKTYNGFIGECVLKKKDGSTIFTEIKASVVFYDGEAMNCTIFRDISERKKKENKLKTLLIENNRLKATLEAENGYLKTELKKTQVFDEIITVSKKYKKLLTKIEEVASTNSTVIISGETGTGKELIARAIHKKSKRKHKSLVKINCATLSQSLIESELFGHEIGAFTGAIKQKKGLFEVANGATLFLDEIGELPLNLQAKLLRVLQDGEFYRIGGNQIQKVDVRIIAATNRKLIELVKHEKFRADLYYRLNVFPIVNLPLRERKEDIPVLIHHFIKKYNLQMGRKVKKINNYTMKQLTNHSYPGNVRELENIIERAVITSKGHTLNINGWGPILNVPKEKGILLPLDTLIKKHILKALNATNWKITGKGSAAELLVMNNRTLQSKMRKLGIKRQDYMV